ncbi:MAG: hypothetical protein PUB52_04140 [Lachnospiraceae bacterium]|nr:hypothetical protein [Lachnospiraceae bacterium]
MKKIRPRSEKDTSLQQALLHKFEYGGVGKGSSSPIYNRLITELRRSPYRNYNRNAQKKNMLDYLMTKVNASRVVSFGTIQGQYTHLIEPGDSNRVVKIMKKEYEPFRWHR